MGINILDKYFSKRYASRFIILGLDVLCVAASFILAYLLRFNFQIPSDFLEDMWLLLAGVIVIRAIIFKLFNTYLGLIRFTSEQDARKIFLAISISLGLIGSVNVIYQLISSKVLIPYSILLIDYIFLVFTLIIYRIAIKSVYEELKRSVTKRKVENVVIFGAGNSGLITKKTLDVSGSQDMRTVAFFDDNTKLNGKKIDGIPVYHTKESDFKFVLEKHNVKKVIISIQAIRPKRKQELINLCLKFNLDVMVVPPAEKWIHGELSLSQIKSIKIEDLLNREPIKLDNQNISNEILDKTVMVTGAAGSIGSELIRQLLSFAPAKLILIDQAESPLVEIELEIQERFQYRNISAIVADVTDEEWMDHIFKEFQPDIIFHAAAYKHVPIMENYPREAVKANILGTKTVADLAVKYRVGKFVMISTDKAVNPTNVMGASKRIAEIYTQSLNNQLAQFNNKHTKFITTRFGNVLGSNGSVIPRFKRQIEVGGPVTVTHPEITRYFMTIPEACQLVLEAGAMGDGGEIFIFDMGDSVKIVDLARNLIKLSGLTPDEDIQVVFTGLRPGEKLKEELLNTKENILPTHHKKIMKAKVREYEFQKITAKIDDLIQLSLKHNKIELVKAMKMIVPEFISNNSEYSILDRNKNGQVFLSENKASA